MILNVLGTLLDSYQAYQITICITYCLILSVSPQEKHVLKILKNSKNERYLPESKNNNVYTYFYNYI